MGIKRSISIECVDNEEKMRVGTLIHNQLRGNQDYIDSNIILNTDDDNVVHLWVFNECEDIPQILI